MSDPAQNPDGLSELMTRRATASRKPPVRRTIPPSQHPTRLEPYKTVEQVDAPPAPLQTTPSTPEPPTVQGSVPEPPAAPAGTTADELRPQERITVYVDQAHDEFMDDVRFAAARRRPRVDVSRSAVVRYALDRLMQQMTPEQLYDAIAAKPVEAQATGRKRR